MTAPVAHCDFETRSELDLRVVGLHQYARHPSTAPWCMAWAIGDAPVEVWYPDQPLPVALAEHVAAGRLVIAHNAPFELAIWNEVCVPRFGFPRLAPEQVECTMVAALAMGLPAGLDDAAMALGVTDRKDKEGHALMLRMARPRSTKGGEVVWWDQPEKIERLAAYCRQDVVVERAMHARLLPIGPEESRVWRADYAINARGVRFDRATVEGGLRLIERMREVYDRRLGEVTGGRVQTVGAIAALKEWVTEQGVPLDSVAKGELADLIPTLPEGPVREALQLRQEAGKSSLAKLDTMLEVATADDRMTNLYQMNGAGTGRWAGRKVQPHNFVRDVPRADVVEDALRRVREGDIAALNLIHGPPLSVLSTCLRPLLVPAPGHVLVGGDWSAIEGRGVAWFAGEEWKLEMFRRADRGEGPGAYETTASKILGVPVDQITKHDRQVGKVCLAEGTLVLTRGGWKAIEHVSTEDAVWDGSLWASHLGVVDNGLRTTVQLCGVSLTPDHLVWCESGWSPAQSRAASPDSTFRALASASARLSSEAICAASAAASPGSSSSATAGAASTSWRAQTFALVGRLAAKTVARELQPENDSGGTRERCQTSATGGDSSTGSPRLSGGVTTRLTAAMQTTAAEALRYVMSGGTIARRFWRTSKRALVGTILRWSWTALTSTALTRPAMSASCLDTKTPETNDASGTLSKRSRVYDLRSVGSDNRFTVWSNAGPLLVHNCELAFGYQGGVGAARAFGSKEPEAVVEGWKQAWRNEHPATVRSWYALQRAAIDACKHPGETFYAGAPGRQVRFKVAGSFLWCRLPGGRVMCYPYPKLLDGMYGPQLTYMTVPSQQDRQKGRIISDPMNCAKWARVGTYGGSLLENVVQAFCADFLRGMLVWAEERGDPVVIHTHDDVYCEVPEARAEVTRAAWQERMNTPPAWAKDFPLRADVEVTVRYGA